MKHFNLLILCLALTFSLAAQKIKTVESDTIVSGVYQHVNRTTYTYDANCFVSTTLFERWNDTTSSYNNFLLTTNTNNSDGTIQQTIGQLWAGGSWQNATRSTFTYTSFIKIATIATDSWSGSSWIASTFSTYKYDASNYLIQDSTGLVIGNLPVSKNIYTNNANGSPSQIVNQQVSFPFFKLKDFSRTSITYYNGDPIKPLTNKFELADGSNWVNSDSTTYTYDGSGKVTYSIEQTWDKASSIWVNDSKNTYNYNGDNTISIVYTQNWNGTAWIDYERSTYTYTTNCLLPLTLLNFNAVKQNNKVQLSWKTANEVNTSHFNIQRSTNVVNFTTIGKVNAAGTSLQSSYGFADDVSQLKTNKVYYRLQQEDKDGKITLSNIVVVSITAGNTQFAMLPNPAKNYFTIIPDGNIDLSNATINISSFTGKLVLSKKLSTNSQQRVDISALAKGMYMVNIITNSTIQTQKLIVE